jgi:hypothetical protein
MNVKMTTSQTGKKKVEFVPPTPGKQPAKNMFTRKANPEVKPKHVDNSTTYSSFQPPKKKFKSQSASNLKEEPSSSSSLSSAKSKILLPNTTTIAQATALLSKGSVTPAMKKTVLDKQYSWLNDTLYEKLTELATEMEMKDFRSVYYFYHTYIKPAVEKEMEKVKHLKTGGNTFTHLSQFIPLNKYIQIFPDVVELAQDVMSQKHMKFYKMLTFKIIEKCNATLVEAGYKGQLYLPKGYYRIFEQHALATLKEKETSVKEENEEIEENEEEGEEVEEEYGEEVDLLNVSMAQDPDFINGGPEYLQEDEGKDEE